MEINVSYDFPITIGYLEPLTDDLFTSHLADCHFYDTLLTFRGDKKVTAHEK